MDISHLNKEPFDNSNELEVWEIGLIVLAGIAVCLITIAVIIWCQKHTKKAGKRQEEYTRRMTSYYDSISIDENFTGLNYQLFQTENDTSSTISTNLSTPVSSRKDTSQLLNSLEPTTFKISNGRLPSVKYRQSFSLEDTMKSLQELDQDNISQITKSYKYYSNPNYEDEEVESEIEMERKREESRRLQATTDDSQHTAVFTSYSVLDRQFSQEVTHL